MSHFNPDGSLKAPKKVRRDHLPLLKALDEVPFGMGQKLLIEHLRGKQSARTARLRLDRYLTFGELGGYDEAELKKLILHCEAKGLITVRKEKGIYSILILTEQGEAELSMPQLETNINELDRIPEVQMENPFAQNAELSSQERALINSLNGFFDHFNNEQKKAVVSTAKKILCVAGAGSGKTSVLTKRIAFLAQYRGVPQEKILAITFTRKARKEMEERLAKTLGQHRIRVETFNSFCEQTLQANHHRYYKGPVRMLHYRDQLRLLTESLKASASSPAQIIDEYYTERQRQGKDGKQLFFSFSNDFQTLIEKLKLQEKTAQELKDKLNGKHEHVATTLLAAAEDYQRRMTDEGYRDYTDQLLHTIDLFSSQPQLIPRYEHVLVDEYQDVNDQQVKLLELLAPENLFTVGDPRQSIYGWRGSRLQHILNLKDGEVIQLTTNYRSTKSIVALCNEVITSTGYEPLKASTETEGVITLRYDRSEAEQASRIARRIAEHRGDKKDIFVLARTNKSLETMKTQLDALNIKTLVRTEEQRRPGVEAQLDQVTLATVHAIKGLEAETVYLISANSNSFPCKASDHPVMDHLGLNDGYDGYAEELRVLYVALSRAAKELHLSYTSSLTPFLTEKAQRLVRAEKQQRLPTKENPAALMKLRQWRYQLAKERGCPAYIICSDKTLHSLLEQRPKTTDDLYSIHGLAQQRIDEFGPDILHILSTL